MPRRVRLEMQGLATKNLTKLLVTLTKPVDFGDEESAFALRLAILPARKTLSVSLYRYESWANLYDRPLLSKPTIDRTLIINHNLLPIRNQNSLEWIISAHQALMNRLFGYWEIYKLIEIPASLKLERRTSGSLSPGESATLFYRLSVGQTKEALSLNEVYCSLSKPIEIHRDPSKFIEINLRFQFDASRSTALPESNFRFQAPESCAGQLASKSCA